MIGDTEWKFDHLGPAVESWIQSLADWTQLPENTREALKRGLDDALQGRSFQEVADWRDEKLIELLKAIYGTPRI